MKYLVYPALNLFHLERAVVRGEGEAERDALCAEQLVCVDELDALEFFDVHALPVLGKLVVGDALSENEREIIVGGLLG